MSQVCYVSVTLMLVLQLLGYELGDLEFNSRQGRKFSLFQNAQIDSRYSGKSGRGVKLTNRLYLVLDLIKGGNCTSSFPVCFHGVEGDNLTRYFCYLLLNYSFKILNLLHRPITSKVSVVISGIVCRRYKHVYKLYVKYNIVNIILMHVCLHV